MPEYARQNARGYRERRVDVRETLKRFLIVCEGAKTEPNYFKGFRIPPPRIRIEGIGFNTVSLVEEAIRLRDELGFTEEDDQVWCVFDRDSTRKQQFNDAIYLAQSNGMHVAYSNQAFELWYLLHFDYHVAALHRKQYMTILTDRLKRKYQKNDADMYDTLEPLQDAAIQRAERLHESQSHLIPADANPSTTVYRLVRELRKFMFPYSGS